MPARQLSAAVQIPVNVPTACGRVASDGQGFARNLGFIDPRRAHDVVPPEQDPAVDYPDWLLYQTEYARAVNGLVLKRLTLPRDMTPEEWTITSSRPDLIETTFASDGLGRQHFYIKNAATTHGQNQYNLMVDDSISPAPKSATDSVAYDIDVAHQFQSTFSLQDNEGWTYTEFRNKPLGMEWIAAHPQLIESLLSYASFGGPWGLLIGAAITVLELAPLLITLHDATLIRWGIGSNTNIQWMLLIPGILSGGRHPTYLLKSRDGGNSWTIVDTFPFNPVEDREFFGQHITHIRYVVENGSAVFSFKGHENDWYYRDPDVNSGFAAPAGQVAVIWGGGGGWWIFNAVAHLKPPQGTLLGSAITRTALYLPSWCNTDPEDLSWIFLPTDINDPAVNPDVATTITTLVEDDNTINQLGDSAGAYRALIQFNATGAGALKQGRVQSPCLLAVQEVRTAKIDIIAVSKGDLADDVTEITWEQNKRWRGAEMTFRVKNETGQWSFIGGNELVMLKVAQITGDDDGTIVPTPGDPDALAAALTQVCGGFVTRSTLKKSAKDSQVLTLDEDGNPVQTEASVGSGMIRTKDWEMRLRKKVMREMPAFGGWELRTALEYICNRNGIAGALTGQTGAQAYYDFDVSSPANQAIGAGIELGAGWVMNPTAVSQGGRGHLNFYYTDQISVIHAMDELCASQGFRWGVGPDMVIRAWYIGTYDQSYAYTLDDSNFDPDVDCITELETERDIEALYNIETIYAKDKNGNTQSIRLWDPDSVYGEYGTTINYVGDHWEDVHHAPAGSADGGANKSLEQYGQTRLTQLASYSQVITWSTDLGQLSLMPRQLVTVNITGHNIPAAPNNVYEVIQKRGNIKFPMRGQGFTGKLEFTLGVKMKEV